jgi:transposase InsO family protein
MQKRKKVKERKAKQKRNNKSRRNTGRRYSPSEKKAILEASTQSSYEELYEQYGVCRETIRRWQLRAKNQKETSKRCDQESYSGTHENWKKAVQIWKKHPGLGPQQICNQLRREKIRINVATVRLILEENGYTPPKTIIKEEQCRRYEAVRPLELVHMDFKHFYINKQKAYLLLMQDDYSRFLLGHKLTDSENMESVIGLFEMAVNRYGKMQTLMTDAGSAFYCWNGVNKFQRLISQEYGVDQIKAGSPRSNGKVESVNKQIEKELLRTRRFSSLLEADHGIEEWISFYNFSRTHMGLPPGLVPADRFLYGWNRKEEPGDLSIEKQLKSSEKLQNTQWLEILKIVMSKVK